jgi:hypothetical protein
MPAAAGFASAGASWPDDRPELRRLHCRLTCPLFAFRVEREFLSLLRRSSNVDLVESLYWPTLAPLAVRPMPSR